MCQCLWRRKLLGGADIWLLFTGLILRRGRGRCRFPGKVVYFLRVACVYLCGSETAALTRRAFICFVSGHTLFYVCVTALPRPAGIVRPSARIDSSFCRWQAAAPPLPYWRSNYRGASSRKPQDGVVGVRSASPFLCGLGGLYRAEWKCVRPSERECVFFVVSNFLRTFEQLINQSDKQIWIKSNRSLWSWR